MANEQIVVRARPVGADALALVKKWEGCAEKLPDGRIAAYPDPGSGGAPWTIGWGSTGPGIRKGTIWTQAQCDARLLDDLQRAANEVQGLLGSRPANRAQFDALTSFQYNTGALGRSTLMRKHLAGDFDGAQAEFGKWVHAGDRVLPGLVARRADEAALYGRTS